MATIKIPGEKMDKDNRKSFSSSFLNEYKSSIESYEITASVRSSAIFKNANFNEGDIVYYEFEDGSGLFISYEEAYQLNLQAKVAIEGTRAAGILTGDDEWCLPMEIDGGASERGGIGSAIVKVINFIAKETVDKVIENFGKDAVRNFATNLEEKLVPIEGLYHAKSLSDFKEFEGVIDTKKPVFLFIHGTNSNTNNAFGGLSSVGDKDVWDTITAKYNQNILAFEHHTLTKSVMENTCLLVEELPDEIELCILTHSRGGLILDTLQMCLECQNDPVQKQNVTEFLHDHGREDELEKFISILKKLQSKTITIQQSIKVACPAFGTSLLSDNSVNFVRVLTEIAKGLVPGTIIDQAEKLVISMLSSKDNTDVLPGLEVMTPDSPYLKLINSIVITVQTEQFILAGKSSLSINILHSLKFIGTYIIIQDRSDMVVNTNSMHQGVKLLSGYKYHLAKGNKVHHSSYFVESATKALINAAIVSDGKTIKETEYVTTFGTPTVRGAMGIEYGCVVERDVSGKKPVVVLIPGIMGSTLKIDNHRYWLHYGRFLKGDLLKLDIDTPKIEAEGLVKTSYEKFVIYLKKNNHDVYTHPYDWRISLKDSVNEFANIISDIIKNSKGQPIRVVSHSMGGLLMRSLILHHPEVYKQLSAQSNFRWIMLGTPWYGSYRAVETIVGRSNNVKKLDKIAIFNSMRDLMNVFSKMPGVLELLPLNLNNAIKDKDVTSSSFWKELSLIDTKNIANWVLPQENDLKELQKFKNSIKGFLIPDPEKVYYVAGRSMKHDTPEDYDIVKNDIKFKTTSLGDGTVTWKEGIPQELIAKGNVYYINVSHGQLANDEKYFAGYLSLITNGKTYFSTDASNVTRGGKTAKKIKPIYDSPETYTNNIFELEHQLFDYEETTSDITLESLNVSISHGDLKFSDGPLMIGHFRGEYIDKAEWVLNKALKYALSDRFRNKVYPGELGTSLFILREKTKKPCGALVVGLGDQFELTGFRLSNTVRDGILQAFHQHKESVCHFQHPFPDTISTLVIGSAYGSLSVETSMKSILTGIEMANRKIVENSNGLYLENTVKNVEFVEIYADKAYSIFYALQQFHNDGFVNFDSHGIKVKPGAMKNLSIDYGSDKWNQLTIRGNKKCPLEKEACKNNATSLVFNLNIGIAKEESKEVFINKHQIDHFLFELIKENDASKYWDKQISKVLFERLIPQDFKTNIRMQNNLIINLDKYSASYPWELIQDTAISDKPICITAGMIRQLSNSTCGPKKMYAENKSVFIIGDPILNSDKFGQLPGAAREATEVNDIFERNNFDSGSQIECLIGSDSNEIFLKLYAKPHQYIHIAAHGDFNANDSLKSGVVIGTFQNDTKKELIFLTAADIVQLDPMPEFVFINTCYSGKSSSDASELAYKTYEFAANIGEEFIKSGVKAIIVAGWPVYDDMALLFAQKFYESMFSGSDFGDAVHKAREACYEAAPDKNTWGAYQCYGNPLFKFNTGKSSSTKKYNLPQEVLYDLDNIISQAENSQQMSQWLIKKLQYLDEAINELNINDADIMEKQAMAHYKLGNNKRANDIFGVLFTSEKATFSLKSLEQIYNVQAKIAVENAILEKKELSKSIETLQDVIKKFELLLNIGNTSERYSMLGSTYKRLAYLTKKSNISDGHVELAESLRYYQLANISKKEEIDFYNSLVILQLQSLSKTAKLNELKKLIKILEEYEMKDEYFDKTIWLNVYLTEFLITSKCKYHKVKSDDFSKFLCDEFDIAWNDYGAFHHLKGEYEHQENLIEFLPIDDIRRIEVQKVIDHIRNIENKNKMN